MAGMLCLLPARSQVMLMTGAGKGSPGSSFSLCSGTTLHLTSPNDPTTGPPWRAPVNETLATGILDPTGGSGAWKGTASPTNYAFVDQDLSISASTTYAIEGWVKTLANSATAYFWVMGDNAAASYMGVYVDLNAGTISASAAGTGSTSCQQIESAGNGYWHISFAGVATTAAPSGPRMRFWLADTGGALPSTVADQVAYYNVGL